MSYAHRWQLAAALRRPYPRPETGDVMATTDPAAPAAPSGWSLSPENVKIALQNMSKAAWLGIGLGALLGAGIGYALGRKSSK